MKGSGRMSDEEMARIVESHMWRRRGKDPKEEMRRKRLVQRCLDLAHKVSLVGYPCPNRDCGGELVHAHMGHECNKCGDVVVSVRDWSERMTGLASDIRDLRQRVATFMAA